MSFVITCAPAESGASVAPCADQGTVAMVPVMTNLSAVDAITSEEVSQLYVTSLTAVVVAFFIGTVIGEIIRLIRSA